ncbi:DUF4252 domain-containing protein [Dysgonomonas sp. ZJ709]|uniref:DUF4252 domain-containing protein n=1 Tax=Dysgonomonas sp. ZJ709 TaxID=2709797 RepID=UPI0013ED774F|nr:DUF4252 domain-containing protein [Dysgonomonas sp. ZJ709]
MKTKILFTIIALMLSTMGIQAQSNLFDKFSNNNEISVVYISKTLLSMAPNMNMGGADLKGLANKLDQVEIYTSEKPNIAAMMRKEAEVLTKDKLYESLMTVKDKEDHITFYVKKKNDTEFKELVMVVSEPNECTIIRLLGSFTAQDIQKIANSK